MNKQPDEIIASLPLAVVRAIIDAAVRHAEHALDLEYNSPAGRMSSEEAERALWLVRDYANANSDDDDELEGFDPYADDKPEYDHD